MAAMLATSAYGQLDRAGNAIEDSGGPTTWWGLLGAVLFFGVLFLFLGSFKNESQGFMYLMAAVLAVIVVSCVAG